MEDYLRGQIQPFSVTNKENPTKWIKNFQKAVTLAGQAWNNNNNNVNEIKNAMNFHLHDAASEWFKTIDW